MTPQEQQMLQDLTNRVNQTSLPDKDPEAEQYLTQSLGRNPDALYILAQTVLVQQYALDQAKKQLDAQSQNRQPAPPQKHTTFLGNLLGMNDEQPQQPYTPVPNAPPPPPQSGNPYGNQYGNSYGNQPQPQYAPVAQQQPAQGGFLRNAMQTAAGVAAGAFAFQGIENLMGGFGHHAGYGSGSNFGDLGGGAPREEVVNNYYGDSDGRGGYESKDVEDRRGDDTFGNRLADADSSNDDNDDSSSDNDNSTDDNYDPGGDDTSF